MTFTTGQKVLIGAVLSSVGGLALYKYLNKKQMTDKGLNFLQGEEGYKLTVYPDANKNHYPTVGTGHLVTPMDLKKWKLTADTVIGKSISKKEAASLLDTDLTRFEKAVKDTIRVPLKPYQKDALISIAFNIGEAGFKSSFLARAVNAKAGEEEIIKGFSQWHTPLVLSARRAREARLFLTGNYSNAISPTDFKKYFKA